MHSLETVSFFILISLCVEISENTSAMQTEAGVYFKIEKTKIMQ